MSWRDFQEEALIQNIQESQKRSSQAAFSGYLGHFGEESDRQGASRGAFSHLSIEGRNKLAHRLLDQLTELYNGRVAELVAKEVQEEMAYEIAMEDRKSVV